MNYDYFVSDLADLNENNFASTTARQPRLNIEKIFDLCCLIFS
jgi:hypothetical protein